MKDRALDVWDQLAVREIERFAEEARERADTLRDLKLGSPIEARFLAAFVGLGDPVRVFEPDEPRSGPMDYVVDVNNDRADSRYDVWPQWKVGPYRVDFLIELVSPWFRNEQRGGWREGVVARAVVECDGHDFHERTKEQAKRDRARDRDLQQRGLMVLRFTGSELHADADRCAVEVNRALFQLGIKDVELPARATLQDGPGSAR